METLDIKIKLKTRELFEYKRKGFFKAMFSLYGAQHYAYIFAFLLPAFIQIGLITSQDDYLGYFLIAAAVYIAFKAIDLLDDYIASKRFVQCNSIFKNEVSMKVTNEALTVYYMDAEYNLKWDEDIAINESKSIYKITEIGNTIIYIPKSGFKTEDELNFFKSCIQNIKR